MIGLLDRGAFTSTTRPTPITLGERAVKHDWGECTPISWQPSPAREATLRPRRTMEMGQGAAPLHARPAESRDDWHGPAKADPTKADPLAVLTRVGSEKRIRGLPGLSNARRNARGGRARRVRKHAA